MTSDLNSISIFKFWSAFCPETEDQFILLYVKWVFFGYKLSLNIKANSWRGLNVLDGRIGRVLSQEIFKRFLPPMILWYQCYFLTYIVYCNYFWVDRKFFFIGSVRPTRKRLILWIILESKGKGFLPSVNYYREQVCICLQFPS